MANFNRVVLIGRLTRDPEIRATNGGLKIAAIGFAVSNRKKNAQSGQWEDDPMFIDITAFDRANEGRGLASTVEQYCKKGSQILVEGKLTLDTWDDKNGGGKRSKHKIIADSIQLLDSRPAGADTGGHDDDMDAAPRSAPPRATNGPTGMSRPPQNRPTNGPAARPPAKPAPDEYDEPAGGDADIPF